jgi:hypothetical protein
MVPGSSRGLLAGRAHSRRLQHLSAVAPYAVATTPRRNRCCPLPAGSLGGTEETRDCMGGIARAVGLPLSWESVELSYSE